MPSEDYPLLCRLGRGGDYTGDTFKIASDGAGGSKITVIPPGGAPPPQGFVAAMAAMAPTAGPSHAVLGLPQESARPMLAAARLCHTA